LLAPHWPWVLGIEEACVTLIHGAYPALFPNAEVETADLNWRAEPEKGGRLALESDGKASGFSLKNVDT